MKTSVIRQRVADFLKQHAPFDALVEQDLMELAGSGRVKFHESEEYLFRQGDAKGPFVWTIQQGRVELLAEDAAGERLCDVLGAGDILGMERFTGDGSCHHSARTATDVILYGIPAPVFEATVARYPAVRRFLAARFSVSAAPGFDRTSWLEVEAPPPDFLRARLCVVPPGTSTDDAASLLARSAAGVAARVNADGCLKGMVTALDLCNSRPPAGDQPAACLHTAAFPLNTRAAVRKLLQSRGEPLGITADGSPASPLEAVLTNGELALFCGRDPAGLVRAIRRAGTTTELAPLLRLAQEMVRDGVAQPRDIDDCRWIAGEVIAALAESCIRLADADLGTAGMEGSAVPFCWVMFGAAARGDLAACEFPSLAVVFDDSVDAFQPQDRLYFAAMAGETETRLHTLGLTAADLEWPDGARPSMPLSEWKRLYSETIRNPIGYNLYSRRSFFDLAPLCGDFSILRQLQEHMLDELRDHDTALALLANDTLAHVPPLTFFRGLVLEMDGAQHAHFDIAETVISPLVNAARVFALAKRRLMPAGTLARLDAALLDFPGGVDALRQAAEALRIGLYYQTLAGGTRIDPGKLEKFDQLLLKTAFSSVQQFLEFTVATFVPDL